MRNTLRLGRLAVLMVVVAILAGGVHFVHAFQVRRTASLLRDQATAAEQAGDLAKAGDYLSRYLGLHPDDDDALAKYGLVLDEDAKSARERVRAFLVLEQALRRSPERDDVRRPLAMLAVKLRRTTEAREYLHDLLDRSSPHDAELEDLLGRCDEADGKYDDACKDYQRAVADVPQQVETYVRLAALLRGRLASPTQARDVMDAMVVKNPESFQALLARGRYLREAGLLAAGARDIAVARQKLAPTATDVLLASADVEQENGDLAAARRDLESGLRAHPNEARFLLGLAALDLRAGPEQHAAALKHLRDAETLLAGRAEGLWSVADLYVEAGETAKAEDVLASLTEGGASAATDYLQARIDFTQGKFGLAAALLEDRREELAASGELTRQTDMLLGMCYEQLGNLDQRLAACRRAAEEAPAWPPALLARASALLAAGKSDEALVAYNDIIKADPAVLEARLQAVRLLIFRNQRLPSDKRDWSAADALLDAAPEEQHKSPDLRLTRIDLLVARGQGDEARKQLDALHKDDPKDIRYWLALAALANREAGPTGPMAPTKALEILDQAEQGLLDAQSGQLAPRDLVDLRLARAAQILRLAPEEAAKRLRPLEDGADALDAALRLRLLMGLTDAYRQAGAAGDALRLCKQARDLAPNDLGLLLRLFDLSMASADRDALQGPIKDLVDAIRDKEGTDGATWRCCEAGRLILLARGGDESGLADARALVVAAGKRRPTWSRPPLLQAQIEELAGDTDAAIAQFQLAVDLGEHRAEAIGEAAGLLIKHGRLQEAKQLLEKLGGDSALVDQGLGRLATLASLLSRDVKQHTLDLALATVKDPKDYRSQLWLGLVQWAMGERGQAEDTFRKALKLAPAAPETWKAVVLCLVDAGKKDQAQAELDNARKAVPPDQVAGVLAVGYEALDQRDKAEEQYLAALTAKPDAARLRDASAFYLRGGDVKKAEPLLQRIIDGEARNDAVAAAWARRSLALAWASSGDYKQSQNALDLLDQNLRRRKAPEDQRARALVLASRPGGRREAIQELEASFHDLQPTPEEEFLLARLYEANHDWEQANQHFLSVAAAKGGANPLHLAYYVTALLRHKDVKAAATYLPDLEKADPDSLRTAAVKARVLHAQGQGDAAGRLVKERTEKALADKKEPAVLGEAAGLLEELGQTDLAEEFYRKYVAEVEGQHPEKKVALAAFLARHDRLGDALDLIDAVWDKVGARTAAREEVAALRVSHPTVQHYQRVEARLQEAAQKNPNETDVLVSLADLQDAQGRHDQAVQLYQKILAANPRHALALNNMAWLLAMQGGKPEALELIERAIATAGPTAGRLDTKGVVLLKLGKPAEAARALAEAADQAPSASVYFHLAEAQKAAAGGAQSDAEKSWQMAQELGLKEADLHPLERPDYQKWLADRKDKQR